MLATSPAPLDKGPGIHRYSAEQIIQKSGSKRDVSMLSEMSPKKALPEMI